MPIFASDMLSSVAYAPDAILLALSLSGIVALNTAPWIGVAVGVMVLILVLSYRLNLRAYPGGGGDYEVAHKNLGPRPGRAVASALLVDYVLTLAVALSVFSSYVISAFPQLGASAVWMTVGAIVFVTLLGVRGWRANARLLSVPTYLFLVAVGATLLMGIIRLVNGQDLVAPTTHMTVLPDEALSNGWHGLVVIVIIMRAFSSGSVAVAGVETVANAVPNFAQPRGVNAGNTLLLTGILSAVMLIGLTWMATLAGVKYVANPTVQLVEDGQFLESGFHQQPVLNQLALAVFDHIPLLATLVTLSTALVLLVAANTALEGFPGLASRLARDQLLPIQLASRGDRMTFSNGIVLLGAAAIILVIMTEANPIRLIDMYMVGVFGSFALGQWGMVKHWSERIRSLISGSLRTRLQINRIVNTVGAIIVTAVLVVVLVSKFFLGAWITLAGMVALYVGMGLIRRHYLRVARDLSVDPKDSSARALPPRTHAVVVVQEIHKPTLRAVSFARASRPSFIHAVAVAVDEGQGEALQQKWDALKLPVELTLLESPYRELVRPVMNHLVELRAEHPGDLIAVYIPQYIVGRKWEQVLHNQTLLRLRTRLMFFNNVVVVTVPWRLKSFERNVEELMGRRGDIDEKVLRSFE